MSSLIVVHKKENHPLALLAKSADDRILLIEDAVVLAISCNEFDYALEQDLTARGIECDKEKIIDMARFVELSVQHDKVISV